MTTLCPSSRRSAIPAAALLSALSILLLLSFATVGAAQDYSFSVPEMMLSVLVKEDASVTLEYEIIFECSPGAHAIDVVDMGLPHKGYNIGNMEAAVNGNPLSGIKKSTYIDCGVEVPLGAHAIQPGQRGEFVFICNMPKLIYQDTTRKDYASLQITPTWWGSEYVQGSTKLAIVFYFPKEMGIKPEELLYQDERNPFTQKMQLDDFVSAAWHMPGVRVDGPHMVGISFPKGDLPVIRMTVFGLFMKWWREASEVRTLFGIVLLVLFGIMFFRASQGTGWSCFLVLLVGLVIAFATSPAMELLAIPALPVVWYFSEKSLKRKRGKYLPAIASVEGGGPKRGLNAPEAAVILEMPLGKVLALTIFGLLKKGIVEQIAADPLEVRVKPEYKTATRSDRRTAAAANGTVIHGYEQPFLDAIVAAGEVPVNRIDFSPAMKEMVKRTAKRVEGFDLERTRSYYRNIVNKAWHEAKAIGDVEQRTSYTDDNLLWLMVDDGYDDNFMLWHTHGYYYHAPWVRATSVGGGMPTPATPVGGRTSFGDVSSSFAGWAENVTGGLASHMDGVSVGLTKGGVIDLSGVDKVTVDMLESMSEGGSGGGGGGGCACAGCACACACAGGGR